MTKKISLIGITTGTLYFISVGLFLITKTEVALSVWELMTIFSAPVVLFILLELSTLLGVTLIYRNAMLVFMSCTCALTGVAHIVNLTVTRRLISEGVNVPTYFQIGYWPSIEMATDYLAWGFFMGLAFLCIGLGGEDENKHRYTLKITLLICGLLCLIGFFGSVFINENIWYVAPMGYGFGSIVICIQMYRL
ncbi:MAG: hypothetical protein ACI4F4_11340 [Lachnospiraceae bacterium]